MSNKSFLGNSALSRGIRNNNPGNIKKSKETWLGKLTPGSDSTFEQFSSVAMGLRACMLNLRTYYKKHGLKTIRQIINRWAPGAENNTNKYINAVAGFMSVNANAELDLESKSTLINLTKAIVKYECGPDHELITNEDYLEAYDLMGGGSATGSVSESSSAEDKKKPLNWFVISGVVVALLCAYLLFKK